MNTLDRLATKWALERAEVILMNMALEAPPRYFHGTAGQSTTSRYEPLRGDARNALPEIRRAIERLSI